MNPIHAAVRYIIDFLVRLTVTENGFIHYGAAETAPEAAKVVIVPAVPDLDIKTPPAAPLAEIDGTPLLFGRPEITRQDGRLVVYADIVASAFFLLSRYEEILKPECRDEWGRFLAKDALVFQAGYGARPIVDEYGVLLRNWLREAAADIPPDTHGFSKIYLTHDVDDAFQFQRLFQVGKQLVKNALHYHAISQPLKKYINVEYDDFWTFPKIIDYDNSLIKEMPQGLVQSVYFLISAGSFFNRKYYNFFSARIRRLIDLLATSGARLGIHISHEGGSNPENIAGEVKRFRQKIFSEDLFSRHHYLKWQEPEDAAFLESAGITDDFTLSYADCAGFRVGTCRPYRFINPRTKELTNLIIHPHEIMECTLDRECYMNLNYDAALEYCKNIISQVHRHNGELVLLWHNPGFNNKTYQEKLYQSLLKYIASIK